MALLDFHSGRYTEDIGTSSSLQEEDILPLPYLFRNFEEMPQLEKRALQLCNGRVLDIGCGAGNHSLHLQDQGVDVTALDNSLGAIEVCKKRGIRKTILGDILGHSTETYDTLLLLMNGIGLAGTLASLPIFLRHLKVMLKPQGQIIVDSSDIIYMYDKDEDGGYWVPGNTDYYGEVRFQLHYKNKKGPVFDWLYLDFDTLKSYASNEGLNCEMIAQGEHYDYLAKLSQIEY